MPSVATKIHVKVTDSLVNRNYLPPDKSPQTFLPLATGPSPGQTQQQNLFLSTVSLLISIWQVISYGCRTDHQTPIPLKPWKYHKTFKVSNKLRKIFCNFYKFSAYGNFKPYHACRSDQITSDCASILKQLFKEADLNDRKPQPPSADQPPTFSPYALFITYGRFTVTVSLRTLTSNSKSFPNQLLIISCQLQS